MSIPTDLRDYLSVEANRRLGFSDGEVRDVTLYPLEELSTRTFDVDTCDFDELPADFDRRYEYKGVDLVKTCKPYNPIGVLIWFASLNSFGAWDCDHHRIRLFPGKSWTEIMREPVWYFNGQWYPEKIEHKQLKPWEDTPGDP